MDNTSANIYTFNGQDYEMTVRLFNGINDIHLTSTAWDDLYLEDSILDFFVRGTIIINSPYDSLERSSEESVEVTKTDKNKLMYKFRNDGRDTLYISIKPKLDSIEGILDSSVQFNDEQWLIELEMSVYDVVDMDSDGMTNKRKKLFFWEKTYQMMSELDTEFTTATVGANAMKQGQDQADNLARSLPTGVAIAELLKSDELFKRHATLVDDAAEWSKGDTDNPIFYTSPNNSKFVDDLMYLVENHTASAEEEHQPCILKLERAKKKGKSKQFSLKSIQSYFKKAGKKDPGLYQTEHFFIEEHSQNDKAPVIKKAPLSSSQSTEIKAHEHNYIRNYKLVDMSGSDYANNLVNRYPVSFNSLEGQFNVDAADHVAEAWKEFYNQYIKPNVLVGDNSNNSTERLPITPYIKDGRATSTVFSVRPTDKGRYALGRNKILKYFLFSNLGISFSCRGLTMRQPGRFFGLSKQTLNDEEYDHKLEGQYFVSNVIHYFSPVQRAYYNELTAVKTHTYKEEIKLPEGDILIITE